ncbi:MAG: TIGR02453 family protein [Anaerolineales bacterium]|nr:TIGR02453 family protein [Anaerolineales bacterium]
MAENGQFQGFPEQAMTFFAELKNNNDREWFNERKEVYQKEILAPAQDFVVALGDRLKLLSAGIEYDTRTNGRGSIMRIYRDIRFSKDKSPYKTNLGIMFWEGKRKKTENPGYFFHMDDSGAILYAGLYQFPKVYMNAYRNAVIDEELGNELETLINEMTRNGEYKVGGEHYKRVPRGYDAQHPRGQLLRHNGLWSESPKIDAGIVANPDLVDVCFDHASMMLPLHRWLVDVDTGMEGG